MYLFFMYTIIIVIDSAILMVIAVAELCYIGDVDFLMYLYLVVLSQLILVRKNMKFGSERAEHPQYVILSKCHQR